MNEKEIGLTLESIKLLETSISSPDGFEGGKVEYGYDLTSEYSINHEDGIIQIVTEAKIHSKENPELSGMVKVLQSYSVSDKVKLDNDSVLELSTRVLNRLVVGTVRGLMAYHFKGTLLHNAYLPIVEEAEL